MQVKQQRVAAREGDDEEDVATPDVGHGDEQDITDPTGVQQEMDAATKDVEDWEPEPSDTGCDEGLDTQDQQK